MHVCVCKWFSGSAHERKLKMVGNNICVVVSFLNGSIQNLSIRHATFLISNSYVRYVNKLLRIFAHTHTQIHKYTQTSIWRCACVCASACAYVHRTVCVCLNNKYKQKHRIVLLERSTSAVLRFFFTLCKSQQLGMGWKKARCFVRKGAGSLSSWTSLSMIPGMSKLFLQKRAILAQTY